MTTDHFLQTVSDETYECSVLIYFAEDLQNRYLLENVIIYNLQVY